MRIKSVEHISELSESNAGDVVVFESLKDVRIKNLNRIVLAHLNINSLRNKFDLFKDQIKGNVDVLVISETKLDDSFPTGQFKIPGYASPFRLDRDENGGGIMVFVREDIPVKFLSSENKPIEAFFFELNFHRKKWLVCCSYNPSKNNISSHLEALRRSLDIYSALYENTIPVGDFNVDVNDPIMGFFCESYNFKSLIKDPTCFKNPENPSCIDLILTNSPYSFQNYCVIETGLSDFHKMTVSVMKTTFQKLKPKIVNYRDYSGFSNDDFRKNLLHNLSLEIINTNGNGLEKFLQICIKTLDKMAPIKKKYVRGNNMRFFNKELSGAHKKRTQLRNRFLRGFSAQDCLLAMPEKWKSAVDKGKIFGILMTDLSKAFDCLSHELIIAKLSAYGFSLPALKLMQSYPTERKQRTKINQAYSSWEEIPFGVPQGSILGPVLFNIFLSDLFLIVQNTDFASYADDNTIYNAVDNIEEVVLSLQESSKKLFKWFSDNQMKSNGDKCHLIVSTNDTAEIQIGEYLIKSSTNEKLLGVNIDSKLTFDSHVSHLCNKANQKLRALARITPYMTLEKKKLVMNSFFNAQFNYSPLIWMLHSRKNSNKIKYLHERCLRLIYSDKKPSYENLLENDNSVSIHHKNIQALAIEMFKVKHKLCPDITSDIFKERTNNQYNLRNCNDFVIPRVHTVYHGTESITYLGPKIWDIVPEEIKQKKSLNSFKESIKKWKPIKCPCRLCKVYLDGVGFINST